MKGRWRDGLRNFRRDNTVKFRGEETGRCKVKQTITQLYQKELPELMQTSKVECMMEMMYEPFLDYWESETDFLDDFSGEDGFWESETDFLDDFSGEDGEFTEISQLSCFDDNEHRPNDYYHFLDS